LQAFLEIFGFAATEKQEKRGGQETA